MGSWTPEQWNTFFNGLGTFLAGSAAAVVSVIVAYGKLKEMLHSLAQKVTAVEDKVDQHEERATMRAQLRGESLSRPPYDPDRLPPIK